MPYYKASKKEAYSQIRSRYTVPSNWDSASITSDTGSDSSYTTAPTDVDNKLFFGDHTSHAPHTFEPAQNGARLSNDFNSAYFAAYVIYYSHKTSLTEYMRRISTLGDTFGLRFRCQSPMRCNSGPSSTSTQLIHDLNTLETMFRSDNVIVPSSALLPAVRALHSTLRQIKTEVENGMAEIKRKLRTLHPTDFVEWVYDNYRVGKNPFKVRKSFFRHHHDSHHGDRRNVTTAIGHYTTVEAMNDKTMTGVMGDAIVQALRECLTTCQPAEKSLFSRMCRRMFEGVKIREGTKESRATHDASQKLMPEDRLSNSIP